MISPTSSLSFPIPTPSVVSSRRQIKFGQLDDELKHIADRWDQVARPWSSYVERRDDLPREYLLKPKLYEMLGDVNGLSILDAGCGEGDYCRELSQKGAKVTGIDISPGLIAEARRKQTHPKKNIRYDVGSITNLKALYADQSFDRLISIMTLMDSPALDQIFQEFNRVLKKDGQAVLVVKHPFITRDGGIEFKMDEAGRRVEKSVYSTPYASEKPFTCYMNVPSVEGKEQPPIKITHYPRSVANYVNALIKNGFTILELQETVATPDMVEEQPGLAIRAFDPVHLMIRVSKRKTINLLS